MKRRTWYAVGGGLASVAVLASAFAVAQAQQKAEAPVRADRGKYIAEGGAKAVVAAPVPDLDIRKGKIERPTETVLAKALAYAAAKENADQAFVNPKVPPGKVTWHADFAAACQASAKSGRPVLLFQMMGKLDDKFC